MRAANVNMAVAQPTKSKAASKQSNNANPKAKSQMHRRSRTGWYSHITNLHYHLHRLGLGPCVSRLGTATLTRPLFYRLLHLQTTTEEVR